LQTISVARAEDLGAIRREGIQDRTQRGGRGGGAEDAEFGIGFRRGPDAERRGRFVRRTILMVGVRGGGRRAGRSTDPQTGKWDEKGVRTTCRRYIIAWLRDGDDPGTTSLTGL
jgi:hypothetical protein